VVCLGSLVAPLDTTVNTAFPVITAAFGLAMRDIQWVVIAFVLAQTSLALVFGHLGDRIGHRRVFAAGMAACVLGHLAVALAPNYPLLVAARVLQGMAVGMAVSCAPALVTLLVPPADKAKVLAIYAAAGSLGMALGPWLGGLLIQAFGWPGVFFFRAPIALLALLMLPAVPTVSVRREQPAGRFDWPGALGLIGVLAALALGLAELTRPDAAALPALPALALGVAGALAWVRHESRVAHPVMRIAPFRSLRFAGMQAASVIINLACFANLLLLPYVLTRQAGMDIGSVGLVLSAYPGGSVLGNALAGRLGTRLRPAWPSAPSFSAASLRARRRSRRWSSACCSAAWAWACSRSATWTRPPPCCRSTNVAWRAVW
jgi:MFS family permease